MIVNSKSKVVVIPNSVNLPMYEKYAPDIDYQNYVVYIGTNFSCIFTGRIPKRAGRVS